MHSILGVLETVHCATQHTYLLRTDYILHPNFYNIET